MVPSSTASTFPVRFARSATFIPTTHSFADLNSAAVRGAESMSRKSNKKRRIVLHMAANASTVQNWQKPLFDMRVASYMTAQVLRRIVKPTSLRGSGEADRDRHQPVGAQCE